MTNHETWAPGALVLEPVSTAHMSVVQQQGFAAMQAFEARAADIANDAISRMIGYTEPAPVKCPRCLKSYTEWNATEFIGWHGICVECFMKEGDL